MADYRIQEPSFYENNEVISLFTRNEMEILSFCNIGRAASNDTEVGIYEISRGLISCVKKINQEEVFDCLGRNDIEINLLYKRPLDHIVTDEERKSLKGHGSFNFDLRKSRYLNYDPMNHIVIVKNFFQEHSLRYLNTPEKIISGVMHDMNRKHTWKKCPHFWAEFTEINYAVLKNAYANLKTTTKQFEVYRKAMDPLFEFHKKTYSSDNGIVLNDYTKLLSTKFNQDRSY